MKYILAIFLFLPILAGAQNPYGHWWMSPGEYTAGFLDSAMHAWTITTDPSIAGTGNTGIPGIPTRLVTIPSNKVMAGVASGLHDGSFWSADSGRAFMYGQSGQCQMGNGSTSGTSTTYEILTDVNGNDFRGITSISPGWGPVSGLAFYAAMLSDTGHSVWVWGNLTNVTGGSTCAKPTPITLPGGRFTHKIYAYNSSIFCIATDLTLWVIGGTDDYAANTGVNATPTTWTQVVITGNPSIAYLAKGNSFVLVVTTAGDIWGFGELGWICKGLSTATFTPLSTPTSMNTALASIMPVDTIVAAHTAWIAKKHDGTLWGAGSNEVGLLGTGTTINWNTYTVSPSPTGGTPQYWNWDVGMGEYVTGLTQLAKGKSNFVSLFGGPLWSFYFFAQDANGNLIVAGRVKAAGALTGIIPADNAGGRIAAAWHMSWNHVNWTPAFPLALISGGVGSQIIANGPGYESGLFTGTPGSFGTDAPNRPNTNLHANLVLAQVSGGFSWSAATSTTDGSHKLMYPVSYISQSSGTALNLGVVGGQSGTVTAAPGTYGITYTLIDNSWDTVTTTQSITVSSQTGFYFAAGGSGTACTIGAPCAPSYFNTAYASEVGGDTNYLNRGDVFPIEIIANVSGTTGNPIVTTWYGSGPEPIVGGLATVTGFSNVSGNLWQKAYTGVYPNFITGGNTLWNVARTPNKLTGYFIPTSMGTNTITDAANVSNVSIGDSIWGRVSAFTLDKRVVSNVAGSTITVNPNWTYNGAGGLGWFKFNTTPDTLKEFRMNSGNLQVYSTSSPTVFTPTVDTCLLSEGTNQVWDHIHFQGGNNAAIILAFQATSNLSFTNDTIDFSYDAFQFRSEGAVTVSNTYIAHMTDNGVLKQNNNNYNNTFKNVTLYDIGVQPGMGGSGNASQFYSGIIAGDSGCVVVNCFFDSVGYIGSAGYGSGTAIDSNLFINWCQQLEDGGAIYTWMNAPATFARQRKILNNICIGGGSAMSHNGVNLDFSSAANGIYLDAYTQQVTVQYNAVVSVNSCAYYDHGPTNNFLNNIALNAGYAQLYASEKSGSAVISGLVIKNNQFGYNYANGAYGIRISTANNDLATFGTIDSNYYLAPFSVSNGMFTSSSVDAGTNRTIASWRSNTGYDTHSSYLNVPYLSVYYTQTAGSVPITGFNKDVFGSYYTTGSITLGSYVPALLQRISLPNLGPVSTGGQIQFR